MSSGQAVRVRIAATFTAEPLAPFAAFLFEKAGFAADLEFAPIGQVFQELLAPGSAMRRNGAGVNAALIRWEDLGDVRPGCAATESALAAIEENAERLLEALNGAGSAPCHVIGICPPAETTAPGADAARRLEALERRFAQAAESARGLQVVGTRAWTQRFACGPVHDERSARLGAMPYTEEFYAALGAALARKAWALRGPRRKAIALDCDDTLWDGVCGEAGALGVRVDEGRRALQEFALARQREGMVLCLCSKNNEQDALAVFERHPDMRLRLEHVAAWRINWLPKSQNLAALAAELNLGLDSFVFVDDNPAVCAEVRSALPEVATIHVPRDGAAALARLERVWAFDQPNTTAEDRMRSMSYIENRKREETRRQSADYTQFLRELELKIEVEPMRDEDLERVSQLTFRTNQFNCSTVRQTPDEIRAALRAGAECRTARVSDRFGDYGLVGACVFAARAEEFEVGTMLLSCRALGRGVEHRMLAAVGTEAMARGAERVRVRFRKTAKNAPAELFLNGCPAERVETGEGARDYVLKAAEAAALKFEGAAAPEAAVEADGDKGPRSGVRSAPAFDEIAREWSTARALIAAVRPRAAAPAAGTADPADETERLLCRIFREELGRPDIGADDDFFECGGDSFQAVRVFARIEEERGSKLSIAMLFEAPTAARLARLIGEGGGREWESLVPVQPQGSRLPLFCMHAAGGNVLFYRDLAKHLGPDQPLYGLQTKGLHRKAVPHDRIEDMAEFYVSEITAFFPEGPYVLAGSSFGGLVAWEAARQLAAAGREVALIALFDTYGPGYPKYATNPNSPAARIGRALDYAARQRDALLRLPAGERRAFIAGKLAKARIEIKRKWIYRVNEIERAYSRATGKPLPRDLQLTQKAIARALRDYRPQPYGGRVALFRAAEQPRGAMPDPTLGWGPLAPGGIDVAEVPGFHGAVTVDPYAEDLAAALRSRLDACRAKAAAV